MANLKEIVTKAVLGKAKKSSQEKILIDADTAIDTVLGCWVINHVFDGKKRNGKVEITGSYDVNIWYAYDDSTKTDVLVKHFTYEESLKVNLKDNVGLSDMHDIIVKALSAPSVADVNVDGKRIELYTEKEMGVEVVGDLTVRVTVEDEYEEYEEVVDEDEIVEKLTQEETLSEIEIIEDYLGGVNQI